MNNNYILWKKDNKIIYLEYNNNHFVAESKSEIYFKLRKNIPKIVIFFDTIRELNNEIERVGYKFKEDLKNEYVKDS